MDSFAPGFKGENMKTAVLPVLTILLQRVCQLLAPPRSWELKPFAQRNYAPQSFRPRAPAPLECSIEAFGLAGSLLAVQLAPIELIQ